MEIKFAIRHGHLSEANRATIREKVEKLLHIFNRLTEIEVTVDLENPLAPRVDLLVQAEHKHDMKASYASDDLMGAADQVVHKLEQQLRKYKEKIQEHHPRSGSGAANP